MEENQRPIPPPNDEDDEDVHWALSTAGALWGRGEREEALRWLRRAAEQASDANADLRALELFKAAAEVATKLSLTDGPASSSAAGSLTTASAPPPATTPPPRPAASVPPPARSVRPPRLPEPDVGRQNRAAASTPPAPPGRSAPQGRPLPGSASAGSEAPKEPIRAIEMLGGRPPLPPPPPGMGARDPRAPAPPLRAPTVPVTNAPLSSQPRDSSSPKSVAPAAGRAVVVTQTAQGRPPTAAPKSSGLAPQPPSGRPSGSMPAASTQLPQTMSSSPSSTPASTSTPGAAATGGRPRPAQPAAPVQPVSEPRAAAAPPNGEGDERGFRSRARTITRINPVETDGPAQLMTMTREGPAVSLPAHDASPTSDGAPAPSGAPASARAERQPQDRAAATRQAAASGAPVVVERTPPGQADPSGVVPLYAPVLEPDVVWNEDEVTRRRDLTAFRRQQRELAGIRTEDPDDETRDLAGSSIEPSPRSQTGSRNGSPGLEDPPTDGMQWAGSLPSDGPIADSLGEQTLPIEQAQEGAGEVPSAMGSSEMHDTVGMPVGMARESADDWNDATDPADWRASAPRLPTPQVEPLPALRIAVIGVSRAGELRLVALDGRSAPPMGSALGILVPLSTADGEAIVRLLKLGG